MDLIPNAELKKNIWEHKQALADLKSVTMALWQGLLDMLSMKESDMLCRSIIDVHTEFDFEAYLGTVANIIHHKALETAIVKIQSNKEATLAKVEKQEMSKVLIVKKASSIQQQFSLLNEHTQVTMLTREDRVQHHHQHQHFSSDFMCGWETLLPNKTRCNLYTTKT